MGVVEKLMKIKKFINTKKEGKDYE